MKVCLQNTGSLDEVREIELHEFPCVVGRRSDCDCCLPLAFISRRHCQFLHQGEQVLVQDLESYNGTYVNGQRALRPLPIRHGDEVSLGPISFRVVLPGGPQETDERRKSEPTHEEEALSANSDSKDRYPVS